MKKYLFITLACFSLIACQNEIQKPNPFIEENKMEDILYDIALLYGIQTTSAFSNDSLPAFNMTDIFQKYNIDSLSFADNNTYYMQLKKNVYYTMQNRVLDRLMAAQKIADSLAEGNAPNFIKKTDMPTEEVIVEEIHVSTTDVGKTAKDNLSTQKQKTDNSPVRQKKMSPENRQRFQQMIKANINSEELQKDE